MHCSNSHRLTVLLEIPRLTHLYVPLMRSRSPEIEMLILSENNQFQTLPTKIPYYGIANKNICKKRLCDKTVILFL